MKNSGYTLIEVLVALTVLIIGFSALTTMTTRARRAAIAAEELSTVQLTCQTRVNEMLAGVRPFAPTFHEPVTGLDDWFLTVEMFPASKPGITAVRAQMYRERQSGDTQTRYAGTDFFEITHWINNSRLDAEMVQAMQRNPYAMTAAAAMMQNPQNAMGGGMMPPGMMPSMPPGMTGSASLVDTMMAGMPGGGFAGGMPPRNFSGAMPDMPPPLTIGGDTGGSNSSFVTSEQRRTYRDTLNSQRRTPVPLDIDPISGDPLNVDPLADNTPDVPPPLDIPPNDPLDSTVSPQPPATGGGSAVTPSAPRGGTRPQADDTQNGNAPSGNPGGSGGRQGGGGSGSGGSAYSAYGTSDGGGNTSAYGTTDGGGNASGYGATGTGGNTGRGGNRPTPGGGN